MNSTIDQVSALPTRLAFLSRALSFESLTYHLFLHSTQNLVIEFSNTDQQEAYKRYLSEQAFVLIDNDRNHSLLPNNNAQFRQSLALSRRHFSRSYFDLVSRTSGTYPKLASIQLTHQTDFIEGATQLLEKITLLQNQYKSGNDYQSLYQLFESLAFDWDDYASNTSHILTLLQALYQDLLDYAINGQMEVRLVEAEWMQQRVRQRLASWVRAGRNANLQCQSLFERFDLFKIELEKLKMLKDNEAKNPMNLDQLSQEVSRQLTFVRTLQNVLQNKHLKRWKEIVTQCSLTVESVIEELVCHIGDDYDWSSVINENIDTLARAYFKSHSNQEVDSLTIVFEINPELDNHSVCLLQSGQQKLLFEYSEQIPDIQLTRSDFKTPGDYKSSLYYAESLAMRFEALDIKPKIFIDKNQYVLLCLHPSLIDIYARQLQYQGYQEVEIQSTYAHTITEVFLDTERVTSLLCHERILQPARLDTLISQVAFSRYIEQLGVNSIDIPLHHV